MMTENQIKAYFRQFGFEVISFVKEKNISHIQVKKDYSKGFNIDFEGLIILEVTIDDDMINNLWVGTYPKFKEITSLIPKTSENHVYMNGNLCYAPLQRPLNEKWKLPNFISAVDSLINNYFSIEYIGRSTLIELEHGYKGLQQYNIISRIRKSDK